MPRSKEGHIFSEGIHCTGLITDALVDSTYKIQTSYDVIVIGAGFTGLVAARDLAQRTSLSVSLIEARDSIGGRTWTAKAWGEEFEIGGTWVHW
ncbi:putative FAD/NAD(P)-binding domain superfamily [Septoria linicola]|nr:putative FAD/NAD(P)-binding domain superfamily [Septoria linicola]